MRGPALRRRQPLTQDRERLKEQIRQAFASAQRPPNGSLSGSGEGDEGKLLEEEFADKHDWRALDADFLDRAPSQYASALSFFSDEALGYFLPAYLIADLDGRLDRVDLPFRLTIGFTNQAKATPLNPQRYGDLTRFDAAKQRFSKLTPEEAAAVAAYLKHKLATYELDGSEIEQALRNYWRPAALRS